MQRIFNLITVISLFFLAATALHAESAEDSLKAAQQELRDRIDGMTESMAVMSTDVGILKKLKVSGYLQARFEYNDTSRSGVAGGYDANKNLNANNFYIRRGRIKFTFQPSEWTRYVIYFDGSKNTISLKEAYLELEKLYREHNFKFTAGQFNYPFGYEIELSSSVRDFPERSLAENRLFRGERDRGANFTWTAPRHVSANIGLVQGYGIENSTFTWFDPTKQKDIIGRVKTNWGMVDVGASGYWGETYTPGSAPVAEVPGRSVWYDANGNNTIDAGEVTTTPPVAAKAATAAVEKDKLRYGIDAQAYFDLLPFGGSSARAEFYYAEDYASGAADLSAVSKGWYLWLSQSIGTKFGAAVRYDFFDPNVHNDYKSLTPANINDAVGTLSMVLHYYWDGNVRISAAYDIPRSLEDGSMFSKWDKDLKDNRFTLQFQFSI